MIAHLSIIFNYNIHHFYLLVEFLSLSWDGDKDGSESRRSNFFQKVGIKYVVSAPVNLGNYSVNFFHPFDVFYAKSFFLKIKLKDPVFWP